MIALVLALAASGTPCSYWKDSPSVSAEGRECSASSKNGAAQFTRIIKVRGRVAVVIVEKSRQGQWSTVTMNGKPGVGYEENRRLYHFSTVALDETVDVEE